MKLIAIKTAFECILWSDLSVFVWVGGSCYRVVYNRDSANCEIELPNYDILPLGSITDVLLTVKDHSGVGMDYWEIEITS